MGILAIRASSDSNDVGKNVGIVLGCLAVVILLLPVLSRACNLFSRARNQEPAPSSAPSASRRRHLNAAEIMRLCALRDSTRPPPERPAKRILLTSAEVDLAAPKISWARLVARQQSGSTVAIPPKALTRDHTPSIAGSSEEEAPKNELATSLETDQEDDQTPTCSICLEGYEDDDAVRETVCHHIFHSCCLEQWLMKRRSHCPLCQGDLKLKREEV